jgi:hypothetical protein
LAGKKLPVKNWEPCFPIFYRQSFTRESDSPYYNQAALRSGALRRSRLCGADQCFSHGTVFRLIADSIGLT